MSFRVTGVSQTNNKQTHSVNKSGIWVQIPEWVSESIRFGMGGKRNPFLKGKPGKESISHEILLGFPGSECFRKDVLILKLLPAAGKVP